MHPASGSQYRPIGHIPSEGSWVQAPRVASQRSMVQAIPSSQLGTPPIVTQRPSRHTRADEQKSVPKQSLVLRHSPLPSGAGASTPGVRSVGGLSSEAAASAVSTYPSPLVHAGRSAMHSAAVIAH